jgi:predicted nucleic acid-binding protein
MPEEASVAAITLAELVAAVHATRDPNERAARQDRLQRVQATLEALPFDADAARAYGRVFAAITGAGRKARGKRAIDLLIAATALSVGLPLYTRNIDDFSGLEGVVDIVEVRA